MSSVLEVSLEETVPLSPEVLACPHEYNTRLRAEAPVYKCPHSGIFFISDYETSRAVLRDHETFSNRFSVAMRPQEVDPRVSAIQQQGWPGVDTMLTQDPPAHRRYRGLVNQAFTARRVKTLAPRIEEICNELIDAFADAGECDFVEAFAVQLPVIVIGEQLGVPDEDIHLIKTWSDAFALQLSGQADTEQQIEVAGIILAFQKYFAAKLEHRRQDRRDDIISDVVHARLEGERPLDISESLSILQQLMVAGNQTTTHAIGEGLLLLAQHPDQCEKIQRNPSLVDNLVEEVLRLSSPTANMWRVTTRDTELKGIALPAGSMVQVRYSSANRDEAQFTDGQAFDVTRDNLNRQIAFGHGVHMCIGAALARKEMQVGFRVLLERLTDFELTIDESKLVYPPNVLLRGLAALPIRFTKRK